jgi:hypothetical protein
MFTTLVKAKAKLVYNKKLDTLRLIVAFNVFETNKMGSYKFPSAKNCAYVSGDLLEADVANALHNASNAIRAEIVLVE